MKTATVTLIRGPGGMAVYINDYRIVGPKPLGGGITIGYWEIDERAIRAALRCRPEPEGKEAT
jgi:hypothetical protein